MKAIPTEASQSDLIYPAAGGENCAGLLFEGVPHEFVVGEVRPCVVRFTIDKLAPNAFIVTPQALRVIGGHDLLCDAIERSVPIPGVFHSLAAASFAGKAWATCFNETHGEGGSQ